MEKNKIGHTIRVIIYLVIMAVFVAAVFWKIKQKQSKEKTEIVSVISQWQQYGKPVDAIKVKKNNFPMYVKSSAVFIANNLLETFVSRSFQEMIAEGKRCFVKLSGKRVYGYVLQIERDIDYDTGLFRVHIKLNKNIKSIIRKRYTVYIQTRRFRNVIKIPSGSVFNEADKSYVWAIKGEVVKKVRVIVGAGDGIDIEIKKGLKPGELVVFHGIYELKSGDSIHIHKCVDCNNS